MKFLLLSYFDSKGMKDSILHNSFQNVLCSTDNCTINNFLPNVPSKDKYKYGVLA